MDLLGHLIDSSLRKVDGPSFDARTRFADGRLVRLRRGFYVPAPQWLEATPTERFRAAVASHALANEAFKAKGVDVSAFTQQVKDKTSSSSRSLTSLQDRRRYEARHGRRRLRQGPRKLAHRREQAGQRPLPVSQTGENTGPHPGARPAPGPHP